MREAITQRFESLRNNGPRRASVGVGIEGPIRIEEDRTDFVWFIVAAIALHGAIFAGSRVQASASREARLVEIEMIEPPMAEPIATPRVLAVAAEPAAAVRAQRRAVAPKSSVPPAPIAAASSAPPSTEVAATGAAIPSTAPAREAGPVGSAATPSAAIPSASASTGIDVRGLTRGWFGELNSYFGARALRAYPRVAQREGLEGVVLIALVIDEQGQVHSVRVKRSSGHPVLDEAALSSVRALNGAPAPPGDIHWGAREISLPIDYRLN